MEELISVIVPIYNVEKYLNKCIESIINQSYSNLEIILVDDGSKDNASIMCDSYLLKDNRIKVIHKENGGLSDARNVGIEKAKGKYIIFIDSDDWIDEKMIEILYDIIKKNNSDISICDYFLAYNEEIQTQKENIKVINLSNIEALKKIYDKDLDVCMIVAWNKLYKIDLFKDNIRYPYGKIHEDEFTTYKLLYKAEKISYTNRKMYYYRQREKSIMSKSFNKKRLDVLEALEERAYYMKNTVKDEGLYKKTLIEYYGVVIKLYFKYEENYVSDKKTLKMLLKKARKIYMKNIVSFKWNLKLKIIYTTFIINPNIYKVIERISFYKKSI